jgi:hypothetical protein
MMHSTKALTCSQAIRWNPHMSVPIPNAKPCEPQFKIVSQRPNVRVRGEVSGRKGGVETSEEDSDQS